MTPPTPAAVSRYSPKLVGLFCWYLRGYVRKHFHAFALCRESRPQVAPDERLVVYVNHASWWDPLVALLLAKHCFPGRKVLAPFDADAIRKYPLFERMGFFGVDQASRRGAAEFLRTAAAAVSAPDTSLWLTPEGRFCDPRDSSASFEPGLAHLAKKLSSADQAAVFLPLAIEYPFWEERQPEALMRFGEPVRVGGDVDYAKEAWQERLESGLRSTQDRLRDLSIERDSSAFEVLLGGRSGVSGPYDALRRLAARVTGKKYQASHGEKLQT